MGNRDRHDITFEILRKASSGKRKTELMRDVGLSYVQSKSYLSVLVEKGLLAADEKRFFKTTSKGLEFLEKCEQCPLFKWDKRKK
jgi:predicted transcriptional regulator